MKKECTAISQKVFGEINLKFHLCSFRDSLVKLIVLVFSPYVLTVSATEVLISKAPQTVERFGKDSYKYMQTVS